MKALTAKIENGKFVGGFVGEEVVSWDFNNLIANGWYCIISENGTLTCKASQMYPDGRHLLKLVITPGKWLKFTIRRGNTNEILLKTFRVKKWPLNGELILTDGEIEKRKIYFREKKDPQPQPSDDKPKNPAGEKDSRSSNDKPKNSASKKD